MQGDYKRLAECVYATTHRMPTTGVVVPSTTDLMQSLRSSHNMLNELLHGSDQEILLVIIILILQQHFNNFNFSKF